MRHSLPNKSFRRCFVFSSCWGKISIESHKRLGIVLFWRSFTMCSVQKTHATLNQSNLKLTAKWILATRIEFLSAPCGIHLSVDWLLWLRILLFRFTTHTQSRCLLRSFFFKQKKNHFWNKHFPRNYQFKTTSVQDARIWRHAWLLTPRIVNNKRKFRITYVQHNGGKRNRETVWFSWRWHNLWIGYPLFILWGI